MRIFTDPHLGRNAGSHTTRSSSQALDKAIFYKSISATTDNLAEGTTVVCAGDLFDKSHNKEAVILDGLLLARNCDIILAGNHDLSNRDNTKTSIEVIADACDNVVRAPTSQVLFESYECDEGFHFAVIPHHSSQDLFDHAIERCVNTVNKGDIVFLHCNFNNPFATNDTSLNLSTEQAEHLLTHFKYIVMGHEHNSRWEMNGRLLVLGNTHPTNFGDMSDKFYWDYSPSKGFVKTQTWDKATQYVKINVLSLINDGFTYSGKNFVEVVGEEIDPELAPKVAQAMQDVWDSGDENLYMVRNNVKFKQLIATSIDAGVQLEDVTQAISADLKETDLSDLWEKHLGEATNAN